MPGKGKGRLRLAYQNFDVTRHLLSRDVTGRVFSGGYVGAGKTFANGEIAEHTGLLEADYGISDRWALGGSVAYVGSRYVGRGGHPALRGRQKIDDGRYHPTFQDAAFELKYLAARRHLAVVPFVRFMFPTHSYVNVGHSAVGRGLKQLQIGTNLERPLGPVLPRAYARATLAYAFVESPALDDRGTAPAPPPDLDVDKRQVGLEVGYYLGERVVLNAFGSRLHTEGGIDWARDLLTPSDYERVGHVHDAAARDRHTVVGGGIGVAVTRRTWLYVGYSAIASGQNVHDGSALSLGASWSFDTRRPPRP